MLRLCTGLELGASLQCKENKFANLIWLNLAPWCQTLHVGLIIASMAWALGMRVLFYLVSIKC